MTAAAINLQTISLYSHIHIQQRVAIVWEEVFRSSNRVIGQSKKFDFLVMKAIPNPNIHTMLVSLQIFTDFMDIIIRNTGTLNIEHDEIRLVLNAREQLRKLERVANALVEEDEEEYNTWITALERQAQI